MRWQKNLAKVEMIEVKPVAIIANVTTNKNLDVKTGLMIDIKHDGNIHLVAITIDSVMAPVASIRSQSIWRITTPDNGLFLKPLTTDLMNILINMSELAIAHNRGMFECTTMLSEFQDVKPLTPSRQDLSSKISFDVDKYLLSN